MKGWARAAITGLGLVVILILTLAVFGLPIGPSLGLMFRGAFGDWTALTRTLVKFIPLTITTMGIIVSWKAGMYNIGGEGQFLIGGLSAAMLALVPLPPGLGLVFLLVASCVGGGLWGALAGWLRAKRGVEVVISTILLNVVAAQLLAWAVAGPLKDPKGGVPLTAQLPDALMLPRFDRQNDLHAGIFIAILVVLATHAFLYWTKAGFRMRLVGEGERTARANRVPTDAIRLGAMALSGALCGLAGGVEYTGVSGQLGTSFAQGWGLLAIPVALIAGLDPIFGALSAFYFAALFAGSRNLAGFTTQGTTLIYVIQGAAVLGLVAIGALRFRSASREAA